MSVCRTCLADKTDKDIFDIKTKKKFENKTFVDMMLFCLDIMVDRNTTITTKLCIKCYRKILSFHKFKTQAINNEIKLQNECNSGNKLNNNENDSLVGQELEMEMDDCHSPDYKDISLNEEEIKTEPDDVKQIDVKLIEPKPAVESDDEFLSVIKTFKSECLVDSKKIKIECNSKNVKKTRRKKLSTTKAEEKKMCEECGVKVKGIKEHMRKHLPPEKRLRVQCNLCEKTFSSANAKYKHVKRKHLNIKQTCKICNKSVVHLQAHMLVMHDNKSLPFECIACGRRFISKSRLDTHMSVHTKDKPFKCPICTKRFRSKICMQSHERQVHNKEKSHLCQFCSKTFFKKYHLQIHIRSHTKEKPYECNECGKRFSSTTILRNHILIHQDVKNFVCEICDMSFVRSGYLKAHMVSHTKEKRYECKYCDAKFHRSDHRKRHEYTAHQRSLENSLARATPKIE